MDFRKENIVDSVNSGLIVHGVNCLGAMGSGVALAIKNKWPVVFDSYKKLPTGKAMLGQTHFVTVGKNLYVANCYTQLNFGSDNRKYADISAIEKCLESCYGFAKLMNLDIHSVKIGSGLGGLNWGTEVEPIFQKINEKYNDINTTIYYIEE